MATDPPTPPTPSTPPGSPAPDPDTAQRPDTSRLSERPGIRDALYSLGMMFPAAGLMALVFRFPVPMSGYVSGPSGVWDAMLATIVYALAGGFVLVPIVAGSIGALVRRAGLGDHRAAAFAVPATAATIYALVMALGGGAG